MSLFVIHYARNGFITHIIFLVHFIFKDIFQQKSLIRRLRYVRIQIIKQTISFRPNIRPIDTSPILCRYQGRIDMHAIYPNCVTQYPFPLLPHFHVFQQEQHIRIIFTDVSQNTHILPKQIRLPFELKAFFF